MVAAALEFPLGRPYVPAATLRRLRTFPPGATALVSVGAQVRADQPIAELAGPGGALLTEGLGRAAMARSTSQLLAERLGDTVLLSGATEPRRNIRPEVLLSLPAGVAAAPIPLDCRLMEGARVAVATGPGRGARGEVLHVFARQQFTGPGVLAPAANIRLEDGSQVTLPLHALDRVE